METLEVGPAERLNGEPVIFRGCGASELMIIVIGSALVIFPAVLFLAAAAGAFAMGMGIGAVLLIASIVTLANWFQRVKRGRPLGHYQQALKLWLESGGFVRTGMVQNEGHWDVGRRDAG